MTGLNKVMLIGHLGKDVEYMILESGTKIAKFSLATSEGWKNQAGEREEHTEWHNIILWGNLAEYAHQNLKKGSRVYVEGKIKTRSFEDANKQKRYVTEIISDHLLNLEKKQKQADETILAQEDVNKDFNLPF